MSFLRGNFRRKATDVSYDAIGGAVANWIQASNIQGTDRQYGGFLVASFASQLSGAGFLAESAFDLFSSTYGATLASNLLLGGSGGSSPQLGFKPLLFAFMDVSGDGVSSPVFYGFSVSNALSADDSVVVVVVRKASQTVGSGVMYTSASNISVHFVMQGWIVSTPFAVH